MTQANEGSNCAYDENTYATWAAEVLAAAGGQWREDTNPIGDPMISINVRCPRCNDDQVYGSIQAGVFGRMRNGFGDRPPRPEWPDSKALACSCTSAHTGRPSTKQGCGAFGDVAIPNGK